MRVISPVFAGFEHPELEYEDVAAFAYRPTACHRGCRMVVRRNISKSKVDSVLFDEIRCHFCISNDDRSVAPEQIVFSCKALRSGESDQPAVEWYSFTVCSDRSPAEQQRLHADELHRMNIDVVARTAAAGFTAAQREARDGAPSVVDDGVPVVS